ncbi:hypothetical protein GCM10022247_39690 [Allokutzneria multivorans]|uniref:Uncharacterized protein n=1 Tax=Allokutzneria multivorans TaxID=1142134 RepID=A0ABP7SLF5_9PSEU
MIVVTAIVQRKFSFAESLGEAEVLIDDALSGRFWDDLVTIYTSDRPCSDGCCPGHQMGLGTEASGKLAAAHLVRFGEGAEVLQSQNPTPLIGAPEI